MKTLYHATTNKKAKKYRNTGYIKKPVRGFTTPLAAMAWAMKTNRTVIYEIKGDKNYHKLPDHHNDFGEAWWFDEDIKDFKCYYSSSGK